MRAVTLLIICLVSACKEGDPERCESAVRNYGTLMFWRDADASIAKAPPEKRDELRKQKLAEFTQRMDQGLQTLVTQCVSANDKKTIQCMIDAKTADDAEKCAPRAKTVD